MSADSPFRSYSDQELKRAIDRLVGDYERSSADQQEAIKHEAALLRDELILRLRGRGQGGEATGVREPRRPRPGGSAAAAVAHPSDDA